MKAAAIITNLSILLLFVAAALLNEYSDALYYLSVQEDELLEWATFWGFMIAAAIYFSSAYRPWIRWGTTGSRSPSRWRDSRRAACASWIPVAWRRASPGTGRGWRPWSLRDPDEDPAGACKVSGFTPTHGAI